MRGRPDPPCHKRNVAHNIDVIEVLTGQYEVGDDGVANASPRHSRVIDAPFWIDLRPLSVEQFSVFVAAGGYRDLSIWQPPLDSAVIDPRWESVDARCESIRKASAVPGGRQDSLRPVIGLTWFEAMAVARFFSSRLPFEIEWEIAATGQGGRRTPMRVLSGVAEWTADAFSPKYWLADYLRRGVSWPTVVPGTPVTIRGTGFGDLFCHTAARRGRDPGTSEGTYGFRRVWDVMPPGARVVSSEEIPIADTRLHSTGVRRDRSSRNRV